MKKLVIIGAGGMGREIYYTAINSKGYGIDFVVKGFIDDDLSSLDGFSGYPPLLGSISEYEIEMDDVFACSIGNVQTKVKVCEMIKRRGGSFQTLIHNKALLKENVTIGDGTIVDSFAILSCDTKIGENCLIQQQAIIGHDVVIGDYTRIDCQAMFVGGVRVGNRCTVHTSAVCNHHVVLEDDSIVGAQSFVIRKVKAGTTVCGNPAKRLNF